ncbi:MULTISPECIES: FISUMP domain-containing protein [unclassified Fibrobacter]|uniref:FISUMP domain-containing protein n=1 Tax=unclassified Fibrobacter TaxID=2634177 RepID=UPI000D6CB791|nr:MULTISPECIES: FISUMP domain-containing protein [unclassified Fibrobacter]PWJ70102.1 uncharacterized protein (TIGR02145 family) [Fibrobacter sp. UWR4]PZW73450.1 uncharacterized protein (TIGR02145 family) [Fibrobacter sp. UWR1]
MKKITALLGFLGVVSMFSACSETISEPSSDDYQANVGTSSAAGSTNAGVNSSASSAPNTNVTDDTGNSGNTGNTGTRDTTFIRDTVRVEAPVKDYVAPYSSTGVFCWSAECSATVNSATSTATSSAATIEVNMSSTIPTPPLVSGNQMIDQRDQKSYKVKTIAGKMWMEENINYATKSGYFCQAPGGDDMCATYGGFYSYAGALRACPDGWRLPTEAEVTALDADVKHEWWQVGGRFKLADDAITEYGLKEEQGYIWIQADGEYSSFRVKNYGEDSPHEFQAGSTGERAYNVRCVQN